MALSEKQLKEIENIDVTTFSKEFQENLRDVFEIVSYFLSQLEVEKDNDMLFVSKNRGEA